MKETGSSDHEAMGTSRRGFLKRGAVLGATSALASAFLAARADADEKKRVAPDANKLALTIAGYPYYRVRALRDGRVGVKGCRVTFEVDSIGAMNVHAFPGGSQTRGVTEIGLLPFIHAFSNADFRDYELLPIPVLRLFRHKSMYIRAGSGINTPADLRGRKIATPGYSSSGLTWIRGILQHEYGVTPEQIQWVVTGKDSAAALTGGASEWERVLPKSLKIAAAPEGKDESDLLLSGEVDAIFHPAEPQVFIDRNPKVARLFPDHRSVERAYFKKTGIFPIMHMVAIRRDLAAAHPWLPRAVFDAYSESKSVDYKELHKMGAYFSSLPWHGQELAETTALMGDNFYPYGMKELRSALDAAMQFSYEQGLAKRRLSVDEVFNKSSLALLEERPRARNAK